MASDLPKATCLVDKQARTGPWCLDSRPFFGPLWPQALCDQSGAGEGVGWAGAGGLCPLWALDVARAYSQELCCLHASQCGSQASDPTQPASHVSCRPRRPPPHRITPPETSAVRLSSSHSEVLHSLIGPFPTRGCGRVRGGTGSS